MKYIFIIFAFGCWLSGCKREQRSFRPDPSSADVLNAVEVSGLHPGPGQGAPVVIPKSYQETAYA
ncbi:MAG TPA: hypothetical protein VGM62_08230, partial [Chthoniobacterales bacterium]